MKQPELGKKIVDLRKAKCLTQEELVEKCNLNVRTLQRIESGEVTPRLSTVKIIFDALDYNFDNSIEIEHSKFGKAGFIIFHRLEQLYRYLLKLFNLKINTMGKLSIISLCLLLFVFLAFNSKLHSQSDHINALTGEWKLIGISNSMINTGIESRNNMKKIDSSAIRFIDFRPDLSFETRTLNNNIYNRGIYNLLNDSIFVTIHYINEGRLASTSNQYKFKVENDTLHFMGIYLSGNRKNNVNFYTEININEWWVKTGN